MEQSERERREALEDEAFFYEMDEHSKQAKERREQEQALLEKLRRSHTDTRTLKETQEENDAKQRKRVERRLARQAEWEAKREAARLKELEDSRIPPFKAPDISQVMPGVGGTVMAPDRMMQCLSFTTYY